MYYAVMSGKSDSEADSILHKLIPDLSADKRKIFLAQLKKTITDTSTIESRRLGAVLPVATPTSASMAPNAKQTRSGNDRFQVTACGSILDQKTHLEWLVGPDTTISWDEAMAWTKAARQCGSAWAAPTVAQLATLFDPGQTAGTGFTIGGKHWPAHMDPVFSGIGSGSWVWSKEVGNGATAKTYNFNQGTEVRVEKNNKKLTTRVFAVRSTN